VRTSTAAVADPRVAEVLQLGRTATGADSFKGRPGLFGVNPWERPTPAVTASASVTGSNAVAAVADPRVIPIRCRPRAGAYGVLRWDEAAGTITGAASIDNGRFTIADPRTTAAASDRPVIAAEDGTWHRPMSTLDLAALQGLPATVSGAPLALAGKSAARWRERIGNAVPVGAATAIAESLLRALLAAALGTWSLSSEAVWVRKDGRSEYEWRHPEHETGVGRPA
jgi:site-specific DNA-cytosine methylase